MRIKQTDDVWVDEPLEAHLDQLGAYERPIHVAGRGQFRVRVYRDEGGELRIRIGRWEDQP